MSDASSRTRLLLGDEGVERLKGSYVLVLGAGGVGSHCIEALARGGIGSLGIMDGDRVAVTNLNRQSIALHTSRFAIWTSRPGSSVTARGRLSVVWWFY